MYTNTLYPIQYLHMCKRNFIHQRLKCLHTSDPSICLANVSNWKRRKKSLHPALCWELRTGPALGPSLTSTNKKSTNTTSSIDALRWRAGSDGDLWHKYSHQRPVSSTTTASSVFDCNINEATLELKRNGRILKKRQISIASGQKVEGHLAGKYWQKEFFCTILTAKKPRLF